MPSNRPAPDRYPFRPLSNLPDPDPRVRPLSNLPDPDRPRVRPLSNLPDPDRARVRPLSNLPDPDRPRVRRELTPSEMSFWLQLVVETVPSWVVRGCSSGDHWILLNIAHVYAFIVAPIVTCFDEVYTQYRALSTRVRCALNTAALLLVGVFIWLLYMAINLYLVKNDIGHLFVLEPGLTLPRKWYHSKKTTDNMYECMQHCHAHHSCIHGFFSYSLPSENCFVFSQPPTVFTADPITDPTSTIFIKRRRLDVPGALVEQAREDSLFYYRSREAMHFSQLVEHCTHNNRFYHPAMMGLNNSADDVARRYYGPLEGGEGEQHGLLFMMAIGTPTSDSQADMIKGFALKGRDYHYRDRLVRMVFYKDDMLHFLTDHTSHDQFFVLCQSDPLGLRGDGDLTNSLFKDIREQGHLHTWSTRNTERAASTK